MTDNEIMIRIKDHGTAPTLTWNSIYRTGTDIKQIKMKSIARDMTDKDYLFISDLVFTSEVPVDEKIQIGSDYISNTIF